MASAWSANSSGSGAEPTAGSRGRAPSGRSRKIKPLNLKAYGTVLNKRGDES